MKILYYYGKIYGLCPYYPNNKKIIKFSYLGTIYNIFLIAAYTYCYYLIINNRITLRLPRETALTILMDIFALTFQYVTIILSWFIFIFFQNKLLNIVLCFSKINKFSRSLNIPILSDDPKKVNTIGMRFLYVNILYHSLLILDHFTLLYYNFRTIK